ncbi:MAG TPA: DMT family transporter [Candidatus Limnocylindrales bacterium]|nr:DMT family transporter [Candidatus Limnocylindrales bacterium]
MDRTRLLGIGLVVISACGFGSGALFAKPIYAHGVDWMTLLAWRFVFAAALSWGWLLLWPGQRRALRALSRRRVLVLLALGIFYMGNTGAYYAGLETVDASLAALIVYLYPALVAVMSIRFARRLEGRHAWFALALATAGVALAVGGINPAHAPPLHGLVIMICSPLVYAVWIVLAARLSGERRADGDATAPPPHDSEATASTEPTDSAPTAAIMLTATAVGWMSAALFFGRPVLPGQVPTDAWWALFGIGLLATAVAMQAFYAGARRIGAAQASLASTVEPVYTITLAALLLHESLTPIQILGGIMVIMGVFIAQTGQMRRTT